MLRCGPLRETELIARRCLEVNSINKQVCHPLMFCVLRSGGSGSEPDCMVRISPKLRIRENVEIPGKVTQCDHKKESQFKVCDG